MGGSLGAMKFWEKAGKVKRRGRFLNARGAVSNHPQRGGRCLGMVGDRKRAAGRHTRFKCPWGASVGVRSGKRREQKEESEGSETIPRVHCRPQKKTETIVSEGIGNGVAAGGGAREGREEELKNRKKQMPVPAGATVFSKGGGGDHLIVMGE